MQVKVQELKSATGKTFLSIYFDQRNKWVYNAWSGSTPVDAMPTAFRHPPAPGHRYETISRLFGLKGKHLYKNT